MPLYRVTIASIGQRFIEADDRKHAEVLVRESLLAGIRVSAAAAPSAISKIFGACTNSQRRRLIMTLDTLGRLPDGDRRNRRRAALQADVDFEQQTEAWLARHLDNSPPVAPEVLDDLLVLSEVRRRRSATAVMSELGLLDISI